MTIRELAHLGEKMREAQRLFFRSKSPNALELSKRLERDFDAAIAAVMRPGLFTEAPQEDEG